MEYFSTNSVKRFFAQYVQNEVNLKGYYFGQPFDINGQTTVEQLYPGMLVTPINSQALQYTINRTYQITIYDILNFEKSNEIEIISDCEEYAFRLIRYITANHDYFSIVGVPTISPFVDKFLDDVAGVIIDIVIEFNGESNECLDTMPNFTPPSINV